MEGAVEWLLPVGNRLLLRGRISVTSFDAATIIPMMASYHRCGKVTIRHIESIAIHPRH